MCRCLLKNHHSNTLNRHQILIYEPSMSEQSGFRKWGGICRANSINGAFFCLLTFVLSHRSNPELVPSSDGDSDSDSGISASQAMSCLQDRLRAVRSLILSDSDLYTQILEYRPLVLSQFQGRLKAAGIRLGISKLADYLDSQCITFTTAKPGQPAAQRRRAKRMGKRPEPAGENGRKRKKGVPATG